MARQGRKSRPSVKTKKRTAASDYFTQPGKRGAVVVQRKPLGNRDTAIICGIMPSRAHAKLLLNQRERAESVVKDLFLGPPTMGSTLKPSSRAAEKQSKGPKLRPDKIADDSPPESAAGD
jgi:hypothetical protein